MKLFIRYTSVIAIFAFAMFLAGCNDEELLPEVIAEFTHTIDEASGTVTFLNTSENADDYEWDFDDGESSTEINPKKTYATGTYIVKLTASNDEDVSDIFTDTINILVPEVITIPLDFDNSNVEYTATTFNGVSFEIADNPSLSGTNDQASRVGKIINSGAAFEGLFFDLGVPLDLSTQMAVTMDFWADAAVDILLKLEEGTTGPIETTASHGGTGWEKITFNFTSSAQFSRLTLFVDGPGTTAGTFYFDNIEQTDAVDCLETQLKLPLDFDCESTTYNFEVFNGASYQVIDNPQLSGVNAVASKVGEITNSGANWEGGAFTLDENVDFSVDKAITMQVYSTAAVPVLLKFEGTGAPIETAVNHGGTGWEQLTFEFTSSDQFNKLVLFIDGPGTTAGTFYFDGIEQVAGGGGGSACTETQLKLPLDFDCESTTYNFEVFNGASYQVIDNPQLSGVNAVASKVGEITNSGANWEGGAFTLDENVDFSVDKAITMQVYSTAAVPVLLKFEGTGAPIETAVNHGGTGWEQLTFEFTSSDQFNKLVIFIDGPGTTADTFYFDNIEQVAGGGGGSACTETQLKLPIDFDCESTTYNFEVFNGASYQVIDNPQLSGVNAVASKVGEITNSGANWEGGAFTLDENVDFSTQKVIKMKVYSTVAVPVLLKFEGTGAPIETAVNHGGTGWEQLTFEFTSSDQFNKLVIFIDGPGTTAGIFYFDDIEQTTGGGGGGSGDELTVNGDFETGDATGWTSFAPDNNGSFTVTNAQNNGGSFSGLLVADVDGIGSPSFPIIKQANIGVGVITPNTEVEITFDLFGSLDGAGGVVFAEFFSELSGGGVSSSVLLGGGPIFPDGTWTTHTFTTTTGNDVSGGVTLQLKADCGGNAGCKVEAYFDNVSVKIK